MKAFVYRVVDSVSPFGEPAAKSWLLDTTLGEAMKRRLSDARCEVVETASLAESEERAAKESGGALVLPDSLAFSKRALRAFVKCCKRERVGTLRAALPRSVATDLIAAVGGLESINEGWAAPLYCLRGGAKSIEAKPVVLPFKEHPLKMKLPPAAQGSNEERYAVSATWLCNVSNWVHVLRVNQAALASHWIDRAQSIKGILWLLWRGLLGFPFRGSRVLGAVHETAWRAKVHHRALVELSTIEAGAEVGAQTIVRGSFIGAGAKIDEGAQIIGSVIAPDAFVGRQAVVVGSVVYPGALAGQHLMQMSVLARDAIALTNSCFFDFHFERDVRVAAKEGLADSGTRALGVCVGPGAKVAAGVWVASGREVPAGVTLVKRTEEIASRFEVGEGETAVVRDGVVVRLR